MQLQFIQQILLGRRVYGIGEVAHLEEVQARSLVERGIAVEFVPAREAVADLAVRKAVKRK